ncbi:hypothetical protein [Butyrivibrio sp. VCB2006]|uniref:hypothetical protein n=1 Tax=Butyrivibrio sp. VCB2006 TaxID=1280679 RepID=UPI0012DF9F22|nr:hypothetical protein [Butyrivibrio sp. VCB2006]
MKSTSYMMGFALGISFVAIFSIIALFVNKKRGVNKYDEMQERVRGVAYKYAFWAVIITEIVFGICAEAGNIIPMGVMTQHFCAIMIGVLVHVVYSVWHDAYIGLNTNPKRYGILCGALAVINLANGIRGFLNGSMIVDGVLAFPFVNLVIGLVFIIIGVEMLIKKAIDSKQE